MTSCFNFRGCVWENNIFLFVMKKYPHILGFVGLAIHLGVWTPLFLHKTGRVVIYLRRDFVLYILPFGLVRMRTFQFSAWVSSVQTWVQVFTHERGGCAIQRCQNKSLDRKRDQRVWMTSCTGSVGWGFWGFEKKQWVEFLRPNERVEIQNWSRPDKFVRYGRRALVGLRPDDVKAVSIERLCFSLLMSKKGNKKCRTWTNFVNVVYFGFPMSISHLRILCLFHISVS